MNDVAQHCEEMVRAHDKDRFLATLFAPAPKRAPLYALYAFAHEIAQVRARVTQPLAGEIRLQWWREVLSHTAPGDAAGNPVAVAFNAVRAQFALAHAPFEALLDAHGAELYADVPPEDEAALAAHAQATQQAVFAAAARVLDPDGDEHKSEEAIAAAALAHGVVQMLHGAVWRDSVGAPHRRALCALALERLSSARTRFADMPAAQAPAVLVSVIDRAILQRALASAEGELDDSARVQLPQWRRQWLLWRAARRWPDIPG